MKAGCPCMRLHLSSCSNNITCAHTHTHTHKHWFPMPRRAAAGGAATCAAAGAGSEMAFACHGQSRRGARAG
eukprot:scaffold5293_cov20-Tisochrysis_lutea.AAC.2